MSDTSQDPLYSTSAPDPDLKSDAEADADQRAASASGDAPKTPDDGYTERADGTPV